MTEGVMPLASNRVPMTRIPMIPVALVHRGTRYPLEKATIPFPVAERPSVSVAMRHVFDTGRWRGRIDYALGPRRREPRRQERTGDDDYQQGGFLQCLLSWQPWAGSAICPRLRA